MQTEGKLTPFAKGAFSKTPFSHILIYLLNKNLAGTLEIHWQKESISIYFRKGMPAKVSSSLTGKELGQVLLDAGKITHEQLLACQKEMAVSGGLQGQILLRHKTIDATTLISGLRRQMVLKLLDIFPLHDANYAFYKSTNLLIGIGPDELFPLDTYAMLTSGVRTHGSKMPLKSVLDTLKEQWVYLDSIESLQRFKFNKQEREFCRELLVERKNMKGVIQDGVYSKNTVQTVIYVLILTKILKVALIPGPSTRSSAPPLPEKAVFDSISPPPKTETKSVDPSIVLLRKKITDKAALIASQNYFEMLELSSEASSEEIRKTFFQFAKEFHPDKATHADLLDLQETFEYVFSNLSEAHNTLIDPEAREEYGNAINEGVKRTSIIPGTGDDDKKVQNILTAEKYYQKALILLRRDQIEKALAIIDHAMELNSNEGQYLGLRIHLQTRLRSPGSQLEDLISEMRRAEQLSPKSELVHSYFGQLLMRAKRQSEAVSQFEKVLKINPNNIEARRELRIISLRRNNSNDKKKGFFQKLLK